MTHTYTRDQWERIIKRIESYAMDTATPKYLRRELSRVKGDVVTIRGNDHISLVVGMIAVQLGLFERGKKEGRG